MLLRYVGPPDLYYPTIPLEPEPSLVYDLKADPGDGHWENTEGHELSEALRQVETAANEGAAAVETFLSVNVHSDEEH